MNSVRLELHGEAHLGVDLVMRLSQTMATSGSNTPKNPENTISNICKTYVFKTLENAISNVCKTLDIYE